ncbi:hypothetical protein CJ739_1558 [Mariniflexile rhizosphaerae]|nr:hypothetical protein CJ739_1558 [Mariniflexile sp. TRM1-10]
MNCLDAEHMESQSGINSSFDTKRYEIKPIFD